MPILRDIYIGRNGDFKKTFDTDYPGTDFIFRRLDNFFNKKIHFRGFLKEFKNIRIQKNKKEEHIQKIKNHLEEIISFHKSKELKEFDYLRYNVYMKENIIHIKLYVEYEDGTIKPFESYSV